MDISIHLSRGLDLNPFVGNDIPPNLTADDHAGDADISIDGSAGLDAASVVIDGNTLTFVEGLLTACSGAGCP